MLDLRWLGIWLSLKVGGELVQQFSLREAFPFIVPKPPMLLLLPEITLWTRWTADAASASLGVSPPFTFSISSFLLKVLKAGEEQKLQG